MLWERVGRGSLRYVVVEQQPIKDVFQHIHTEKLAIAREVGLIIDANFPVGSPEREIARVHLYRDGGNRIAASGKPDPLKIVLAGIEYSCRAEECQICDGAAAIPPPTPPAPSA